MTHLHTLTRFLAVAGLSAVMLTVLAGPAASQAAPIYVRAQSFTVVSVSASTPNTLIVQRSVTSPEITVVLSPTATIVRRFDGKSNLSEISAGDHIVVTPVAPPLPTAGPVTATAAMSITAAAVKDDSIQVGYSQINGRVIFVNQALTQLQLIVTANEGRFAAIPVGDHAFIDVTPTTPAALIGKPSATPADVRSTAPERRLLRASTWPHYPGGS